MPCAVVVPAKKSRGATLAAIKSLAVPPVEPWGRFRNFLREGVTESVASRGKNPVGTGAFTERG